MAARPTRPIRSIGLRVGLGLLLLGLVGLGSRGFYAAPSAQGPSIPGLGLLVLEVLASLGILLALAGIGAIRWPGQVGAENASPNGTAPTRSRACTGPSSWPPVCSGGTARADRVRGACTLAENAATGLTWPPAHARSGTRVLRWTAFG